jgi:hypothetical protein
LLDWKPELNDWLCPESIKVRILGGDELTHRTRPTGTREDYMDDMGGLIGMDVGSTNQ